MWKKRKSKCKKENIVYMKGNKKKKKVYIPTNYSVQHCQVSKRWLFTSFSFHEQYPASTIPVICEFMLNEYSSWLWLLLELKGYHKQFSWTSYMMELTFLAVKSTSAVRQYNSWSMNFLSQWLLAFVHFSMFCFIQCFIHSGQLTKWDSYCMKLRF